MREELIVILKQAFESGFITSTIQSQIDAIKKKIEMPEAEYQQIENEIRLEAYVRKVQEREKKGITYMGDLRKQYKITDDDKTMIQEKMMSEPVTPHPDKTPEVPPQREPTPERPRKSVVSDDIEAEVKKRLEWLKQQDILKVAAQSKQTSGEPPVILVVDDNETQLFLMKKIIEGYGYTCITADTSETAIRMVTEKQPAMVFCDVNFGIGKPTGMDVFTYLRSKNIPVPFILVSAFFQREFRDQAKRIGINDYITKPVDEDHLIATIKKYLAR
ncbi:MAG: response regulator [Bacteroidota bacterium]